MSGGGPTETTDSLSPESPPRDGPSDDATSAPTISIARGDRARPRGLPRVEGDRYRIDGEIARGGFGRILRAFDRRLERPVAIKELLPGASDFAKARFEREAVITSRLQHPSIIPVYDTAVSASGVPFFAMKLVEGRSLLELLREAKELRDRLALLPIVLAVADGLAYAHGQEILHRDLKPANVLVGPFGEAAIIDWGLAKDLAAPEDEQELADTGAVVTSPALTVAGAVMGTVGYMAPEQAYGEAVDRRADVYALGALLHHVLSGEPPVVGRTVPDYLEALERPIQPFAERAPGVPPDLAAIVGKATARIPAARYPSAAEFAEDLRRFLDGQIVDAHRYSPWEHLVRFVRRNRTRPAVAAILLALLAAGGVISIWRIVHERARAELQRSAAEELVRFVLFDLRGRLDGLGKLALLEGVGEKVAGYYEALERSGDLDVPARRRRAAALSVLGDVADAQGQAARAKRTRRTAIALLDGLATPEDVAASVDERYRLAAELREHGQLDEAARTIDDGLARLARSPADLDLLGRRAEGLSALGDIRYLQRGFDAALASQRAALAIDLGLRVSRPDDARLLRQTAVTERRLGNILQDRGDVRAAAAAYRAELELAATSSDDVEGLSLRATARADLGHLLGRTNDPSGAPLLRQGIDDWRALADRDPANLRVQKNLMTALSNLGSLQRGDGDLPGALASEGEAHAILLRLVHTDPGHDEWLRALSVNDDLFGDIARQELRWTDALGFYRQAEALRGFLVTKEPTNQRRWLDLATVEDRIGSALLGLERRDEALEAMQAADGHRRRVLATDPKNVEYQRGVSISEVGIGEALATLGRPADARAAFQRALELRRAIVAAVPDNPDYDEYLAEALDKIGTVSLELHDLDGAAGACAEALALGKKLVALAPDDLDLVALLIGHYLLEGDVGLARKDTAGAGASYRAAVEIAERLVAAHPESNRARGKLGESHGRLALLEPGTRDGARHLAAAIEALGAIEQAGKLSARQRAHLAEYRAMVQK